MTGTLDLLTPDGVTAKDRPGWLQPIRVSWPKLLGAVAKCLKEGGKFATTGNPLDLGMAVVEALGVGEAVSFARAVERERETSARLPATGWNS